MNKNRFKWEKHYSCYLYICLLLYLYFIARFDSSSGYQSFQLLTAATTCVKVIGYMSNHSDYTISHAALHKCVLSSKI